MLLTEGIMLRVWVSNSPNITQINFFFICISFAKDFFFSTGFPPYDCDLASKNRLKSPPNTMLLLLISWIFSNILLRSENMLSCSFSVFVL